MSAQAPPEGAPAGGVDALLDGWQAAWNGRVGARFAGVCAPDAHYEDPLTRHPLHGPDEIAAHADRMWKAFPDAQLSQIGEWLHDGRFAVAPCRLRATHLGELGELPPSGRELVSDVLFYCELEPDQRRLWRVRAFFDLYAAAVAIGVLPRAGTLGERALMVLRGYGLRGYGGSGLRGLFLGD